MCMLDGTIKAEFSCIRRYNFFALLPECRVIPPFPSRTSDEIASAYRRTVYLGKGIVLL